MDEYYELKKNGVEITFDNPEDLITSERISKQLDDIVSNLDVDVTSTDQEKLNAILIYVLDNLTYDQEIQKATAANIEHSSLTESFYEKGQLYGALEKDTAICGNYTALTNALAERLGLNSYYLRSSDHAWSLIEVDGKQYYVDSTWLDGRSVLKEDKTTYETDAQGRVVNISTSTISIPAVELLKEGKTEQLDWYIEDPSSYPTSANKKESHIAVNLPSFYRLNPQEEQTSQEKENPQEISKLDEEKYEIKIEDKIWIVGGAVAIGILGAFGGAIAAKKRKDKKARELEQMCTEFESGKHTYSPYTQYTSYEDSNYNQK